MWIVFGLATIVTALLNFIWHIKNKDSKVFRFLSLSLTALILCDFYSMAAKSVLREDWIALVDTIPSLSKALWLLTIISILINSISLLKRKSKD